MSTSDTLASQTIPSADAAGAVGMPRSNRSGVTPPNNAPPGLTIARATHVGRVRERNEDACVVLDCTAWGEAARADLALLVVADGMGGHERGEMASLLAAQVAAAHVVQDVFVPFLARQVRDGQHRPIHEALVEAVRAANAAVLRDVPGGGTTLTVALVFGARVYIAHVGDCRAYMYDEGGLRCITRDHSLVARLVQSGQVTAEEALAHRNVLYRAVGQHETLDVDTYTEPLPAGASLVVCSDGLWGTVGDADMAAILRAAPDAWTAVERLVAAAIERGGGDNITVLIATRSRDA